MTNDHLILLIHYVSAGSIVVPIFFSIFKIWSLNQSLKALTLYLIICLIIEFVSDVLWYDNINNLWLFHIFTLLEFTCFMYIFFQILKIEHKQKLFSVIILSFLIIFLVDIIFISGHLKMNELARNVEGFTFIVLSILYFKSLMKSNEHQSLLQKFSFWFSSAILLYFSGSLFIFLFSNYLLDSSPETFFGIYAIHSILSIIFNILLAICFTRKSIDA